LAGVSQPTIDTPNGQPASQIQHTSRNTGPINYFAGLMGPGDDALPAKYGLATMDDTPGRRLPPGPHYAIEITLPTIAADYRPPPIDCVLAGQPRDATPICISLAGNGAADVRRGWATEMMPFSTILKAR